MHRRYKKYFLFIIACDASLTWVFKEFTMDGIIFIIITFIVVVGLTFFPHVIFASIEVHSEDHGERYAYDIRVFLADGSCQTLSLYCNAYYENIGRLSCNTSLIEIHRTNFQWQKNDVTYIFPSAKISHIEYRVTDRKPPVKRKTRQ